MPIKLQFDHQRSKNEKMKNKQEKSQMKVSGDANTAKPVRWDSMEHVRPDFSCDHPEKVQDEHLLRTQGHYTK